MGSPDRNRWGEIDGHKGSDAIGTCGWICTRVRIVAIVSTINVAANADIAAAAAYTAYLLLKLDCVPSLLEWNERIRA